MNNEHQHHEHHQHDEHQMKHQHHKMDHSGHKNHHSHEMMNPKKNGHSGHDHSEHLGHTIEDFRKRFWISLIVTVPILILSPMIQHFLGLKETLRFGGDSYILFALSSFVFFYY
jgi:Cu2+-exporting ATPase